MQTVIRPRRQFTGHYAKVGRHRRHAQFTTTTDLLPRRAQIGHSGHEIYRIATDLGNLRRRFDGTSSKAARMMRNTPTARLKLLTEIMRLQGRSQKIALYRFEQHIDTRRQHSVQIRTPQGGSFPLR